VSHDLGVADGSPGMSSFAGNHPVKAVVQTFIAPSDMKSLAITTSKFGVTSKELVCMSFVGLPMMQLLKAVDRYQLPKSNRFDT
jgi:hypothetical protein